jgi:hypothetical protein
LLEGTDAKDAQIVLIRDRENGRNLSVGNHVKTYLLGQNFSHNFLLFCLYLTKIFLVPSALLPSVRWMLPGDAFLSTLVIYFELVHVQLSNILICDFVAVNMDN